jgi:hypothetical protein
MSMHTAQRWLGAAGLIVAGLGGALHSGSSVLAGATGVPTVSIGSGSIVEGSAGQLAIRFPVTLSVPASVTVTVAYSTVSGSAKAGVDFTAKSGVLSFVPNAKTGLTGIEQTVGVRILPDKAADGTETFSLVLANPTGGYIIANGSGTGTVFDETPGVTGLQANIGDASIYEGYSGPNRSIGIPVTLSAAPKSPVSVYWVFTGGTALWGTDYKGTQYGTLTFAAGQRAAWLPLSIIPDTDTGPDTTIVVTIENPVGVVLGRTSGTISILDGQGGTPDLSVSNSLPQVWEHTPFLYTVTIHNSGNGPAPNVSINASDSSITVSSTVTTGWSCGNLGGFRVPHSGWYCNSSSPVFAGSNVNLQMIVTPSISGTFPETLTVGTSVPQQNKVPHSLSDTVSIGVPPTPTAPTNVQVAQAGINLQVSWTAPSTGTSSMLRSTITATPSGGSPITVVVPGATSSGIVQNIQPSTTYAITVTSTSYTGTGPPSSVLSFTTQAPTVPPGAPQSVSATWAYGESLTELIVGWGATDPGNSAIDSYEVHAVAINAETTPPPLDVVVSVPASSYVFANPAAVSWQVTVRAHNAAGWGPWSTAVVVPPPD